MCPVCLLSQMASSNMSSKPSMWSIWAPPCCSRRRCAPISRQKRLSVPWPTPCRPMDDLRPSPGIGMCGGWAVQKRSDFPSALLRFCSCLGITVEGCDPHHPQQNAFVERYHRTSQEECLAVHRPHTLQEAREVTAVFQKHYNFERPNQALSCGNQPPRSAFPTLASLPALPSTVDPESWLQALDGLHLERKVDAHGMVSLDLKRYSISSQLVGQRV